MRVSGFKCLASRLFYHARNPKHVRFKSSSFEGIFGYYRSDSTTLVFDLRVVVGAGSTVDSPRVFAGRSVESTNERGQRLVVSLLNKKEGVQCGNIQYFG